MEPERDRCWPAPCQLAPVTRYFASHAFVGSAESCDLDSAVRALNMESFALIDFRTAPTPHEAAHHLGSGACAPEAQSQLTGLPLQPRTGLCAAGIFTDST